MDSLELILSIGAAYLWGALPTAYIVGRFAKHIDLRKYGSGNVGSANLVANAGKVIGLSVGVFDCLAKGTLPVIVAKLLGMDITAQIGIGLAAVAGHNWSPYIRFSGGRGVATSIGVLLGFLMWRELLVLAFFLGVIGWIILRDTGFWTFMSAVCLLPLAWFFQVYIDGDSPYLVYLSLGIVALVLLKRMTANWARPSADFPFYRVLFYRILYDRDVPRQDAWVERKPG